MKIEKAQEEIQNALSDLASKITSRYQTSTCLDIVWSISGASFFFADLIRKLKIPTRSHPVSFNSFSEKQKSGQVSLSLDIKQSLEGCDVIFMDGIIISGATPRYILKHLAAMDPSSLKLCAVGYKPHLLEDGLCVDFSLFEFQDQWIEGYGIGNDATYSSPDLLDVKGKDS